MSDIKFVYFDVGGVSLLDFSGTNKWEEMKQALGVSIEINPFFDAIWEKHREKICIDCDVDTLIPDFSKISGVSIPENYSMLVDFVERFDPNYSIWPVMKAAKKRYKVGLLTNMYPRMFETIKKYELLPNIEWDAVVDSSVIGYQKPQPMIYEKAEEMAEVPPQQILFADNSEEHLNEAAKRGWKIFLYDPRNPEKSTEELANILQISE